MGCEGLGEGGKRGTGLHARSKRDTHYETENFTIHVPLGPNQSASTPLVTSSTLATRSPSPSPSAWPSLLPATFE